jgi:sugar/nucleoside kinase (ribokinase family)
MKVILTGSIAFDYLMRFPGYFKDHILPEHLEKISLSFLVEDMVRQYGGVSANIAYTLAMLGGNAKVYSAAGQDFPEYARHLEEVGVDVSGESGAKQIYGFILCEHRHGQWANCLILYWRDVRLGGHAHQ